METLQRTANRGSISTGYDIANSCKFEDDNDEWLYRANVSGTNTKTWTVSWWFKQTELRSVMGTATNHWTGGAYGEATRAGVDEYDRLWVDVGGGDGNPGSRFRSLSTARLRDTAAWYHVVIACDSTQSTEADRLKVWLNGVEVTVWDQHQIPTLNFGSALAGFAGIQMKWGSTDATYGGYSGYLAECNYLDGVTATQNDFGEFDEDSGIWKPKEYTGSYGTNGTYLDFTNASDLGDDKSGNGNDYTLNNITAADQATDTPTNNFCTWNPLQNYDGKHLYRDGATTFDLNTNSGSGNSALGSMAFTKGKWYAEFKPKDATTSYPYNVFIGAGVMDQLQLLSTGFLGGKANSTAQGAGYYNANGKIYRSGASVAWGDTYVGDDIISIAFDYRSDGTAHMYVAKNGVWQNSSDPANDTNPITLNGGSAFADNTFIALGASIYVHDVLTIECNFGGYTPSSISTPASDENGYGTFEYAPPSGYYALCTKNLAEYG